MLHLQQHALLTIAVVTLFSAHASLYIRCKCSLCLRMGRCMLHVSQQHDARVKETLMSHNAVQKEESRLHSPAAFHARHYAVVVSTNAAKGFLPFKSMPLIPFLPLLPADSRLLPAWDPTQQRLPSHATLRPLYRPDVRPGRAQGLQECGRARVCCRSEHYLDC